MPNTLVNLARVQSTTLGTGTLTLGSAIAGFNTFADAGLTDGQTVTYAIEDYSSDTPAAVTGREIGQGVYSAGTLTRGTVYSSTSAGAKINCSGRQHVFITAAAEDLASFTTDLTAHLNDTSGAHAASAISFTPAGNVAATDVQAAIAELDTEKLSTSAAASTYQPLDADLTALAGLATTGLVSRTGAGTVATRTLTAPAAGITVSNGDGVSGNPTLALADDLAALEALSGTNTIYYRSAANTWSSVTVSANLGFSAGTLGSSLGTAATYNVGTSGGTVPLLNGANTYSGFSTFTANMLLQKASPVFQINATSGDANGYISAVSGSGATFRWGTWTGSAFSERWLFGKDTTAESGSNAGSDFAIYRYNDAGGFLATLMTASRADGSVNWRGGLYSNGVTGGSQGNGTLNFGTLYEGGTSLALKYAALASSNTFTGSTTQTSAQFRASGDTGGAASTNTLTATSDLTANSTGVGSIKFKGTTSRDSTGFIKIYVGTTAYYVPVFSAITG